jgi:hypothetical protein
MRSIATWSLGGLRMIRTIVTAAACALSILALGTHVSSATEVASLGNLAGRWSGSGTVTPAIGPRESFRCVVTYSFADGSSQVKQNLRCQSPNFVFDVATQFQVRGAQVSGVWTENTFALTGTVSGTMTDTGFDLQLSNRFFQARLTVAGTGCEQSVKLVPGRADYLKELAAVLKKC